MTVPLLVEISIYESVNVSIKECYFRFFIVLLKVVVTSLTPFSTFRVSYHSVSSYLQFLSPIYIHHILFFLNKPYLNDIMGFILENKFLQILKNKQIISIVRTLVYAHLYSYRRLELPFFTVVSYVCLLRRVSQIASVQLIHKDTFPNGEVDSLY